MLVLPYSVDVIVLLFVLSSYLNYIHYISPNLFRLNIFCIFITSTAARLEPSSQPSWQPSLNPSETPNSKLSRLPTSNLSNTPSMRDHIHHHGGNKLAESENSLTKQAKKVRSYKRKKTSGRLQEEFEFTDSAVKKDTNKFKYFQ